MRLTALYIFILLLVLPSATMAHINNQGPMVQLANNYQESGHNISEWNVTIKEQMDRETAIQKIHKLKKNVDFIKESTDKHSNKFFVNDTHNPTKSEVHYTIIIPKSSHYKAELIVSINGHNWNKSINTAYEKQIEKLRKDFFSMDSKTFACIKGKVHDTINNVYFMHKMKEIYQAKILSKQTDSIEDSMINVIQYGYTPLWKENMTIDGKPINLQFVIKRTTSDALEIRIGTPILINEY